MKAFYFVLFLLPLLAQSTPSGLTDCNTDILLNSGDTRTDSIAPNSVIYYSIFVFTTDNESTIHFELEEDFPTDTLQVTVNQTFICPNITKGKYIFNSTSPGKISFSYPAFYSSKTAPNITVIAVWSKNVASNFTVSYTLSPTGTALKSGDPTTAVGIVLLPVSHMSIFYVDVTNETELFLFTKDRTSVYLGKDFVPTTRLFTVKYAFAGEDTLTIDCCDALNVSRWYIGILPTTTYTLINLTIATLDIPEGNLDTIHLATGVTYSNTISNFTTHYYSVIAFNSNILWINVQDYSYGPSGTLSISSGSSAAICDFSPNHFSYTGSASSNGNYTLMYENLVSGNVTVAITTNVATPLTYNITIKTAVTNMDFESANTITGYDNGMLPFSLDVGADSDITLNVDSGEATLYAALGYVPSTTFYNLTGESLDLNCSNPGQWHIGISGTFMHKYIMSMTNTPCSSTTGTTAVASTGTTGASTGTTGASTGTTDVSTGTTDASTGTTDASTGTTDATGTTETSNTTTTGTTDASTGTTAATSGTTGTATGTTEVTSGTTGTADASTGTTGVNSGTAGTADALVITLLAVLASTLHVVF